MAQSGYTPISLYYSTTAATAPTAGNLTNGELAINITDGKLYYKNNVGAVKLLASSSSAGGIFAAPVVIEGTTTDAALRITQLGTGNALLVEDSANPDNTPFVIDSTGNVLIGSGSPTTASYPLYVEGNGIITVMGTNSATNSPTVGIGRRRTSNASVIGGDSLAKFSSFGWDGTNLIEATRIEAAVDGTPGTNDMPGRLVFSTTADGEATPTERMRIDSTGAVGIGTATLGSSYGVRISKTLTGASSGQGILNTVTANSTITNLFGYNTSLNSATNSGTPYTLTIFAHYNAAQGTINADSTVTNQFGYQAASSLTGATNNYGFYGNIPSGTGRWNFYAGGTADNYFAGDIGLGTATPSTKLEIAGSTNRTGSGSACSISGTTLTVGGTVTGTWAVGQRVFGTGVEPNTVITALGTGTGGAGTYVVNNTQTVATGLISSVDAAINTIRITDTDTAVDVSQPLGQIEFYGNDATSTAGVKAYISTISDNSSQGASLIFGTASTPANTQAVQRMKINSVGCVAIGGETSSAVSLYLRKDITWATTAYGVYSTGTIQPDVTSAGYYFKADSSSAANGGTPYTLAIIAHFTAAQGTFNADSTVTNQYAFAAQNTLTGATNNYGFYSSIPIAAGRWNFYANGTAGNYFAGNVLQGSPTSVTGVGAITNFIQSNSTSGAAGFSASRWVASNADANIQFLKSRGASVGTYSSVASGDNLGQLSWGGDDGTAFIPAASIRAQVDGTPGTNDMPGRLVFSTTADGAAVTTERMRIDSAGAVGIGGTPYAGSSLIISKNITGAAAAYVVSSEGTIQSDVTSARLFTTAGKTAAASFTLANLYHYNAEQGTFGAGSTVTNQYGFYANSANTGATNDFGFYGALAAATGVYNLYMQGTANNYLAGSLGIGTTALTGVNLYINKNITGSTSSFGIRAEASVQSDVTTVAYGIGSTHGTAAASFTLANLRQFQAAQTTIGAGSAVTNQAGFYADSSISGATNNIAFHGLLAAATGRYNLYMGGTANNYLAGSLGIGNTTPVGLLDVGNTSTSFVSSLIRASTTGTSELRFADTTDNAGYIAYDHTGDSMRFGTATTERMRINSVGDVFIGATSANGGQQFYVSGSSGMAYQRSTNDTFAGVLDYLKSRGTAAAPTIVQNGDGLFSLRVAPYNGSAYAYLNSIGVAVDGTVVSGQNPPTRITFNTNTTNGATTERMRIDSSGNLLQAVTSLTSGFGGIQTGGAMAATGFVCRTGTGGSYGGNRFNLYWNGSAMQLYTDASNIGTINTTSDYRVKRNVETQTAPALERVMALRPVTYQMADYGDLFKATDDIKEGFIAHEVQEVIPSGAEGVKDDPDQIQSLRVDAILAVAIKAIQELNAEVQSLKQQLGK